MKIYNEKERKIMQDYLDEWEKIIENSDEPMHDYRNMMYLGRARYGIKFAFFIEDMANQLKD